MTLIGGGITFGDPIALLPVTFLPELADPGVPAGSEGAAEAILGTIRSAVGRLNVQISTTVLGIAPGEWEIVNSIKTEAEELIEVVVRFVLKHLDDAREIIRQLSILETVSQIYAELIGQWIAHQARIAALLAGLPTVAEALRSFQLFAGVLQQVSALFARGEGCVRLLLQHLGDPLFRVTVILGPEGEETQTSFRRFIDTMLPLTIPSGLVFPGALTPTSSDVWRNVERWSGPPAQQSPLAILDRLVTSLNERSAACLRGVTAACDDLTARAAGLYTFWTGEQIQDPGLPTVGMRVEDRWGNDFGVQPLIARACIAAEDLGDAIENFEPFSGGPPGLTFEGGPGLTFTTPRGVGGAVCP